MQDKPKTARFGTTLFLDNPLHRQAWRSCPRSPAGQRTNWLCLALCQQAQREQFLRDLKTILQAELQNSFYPQTISRRSQPGASMMTFSAFCARCRKKVKKAERIIRYFDMFAGVGGFRAGLDLAGGFQCIGHCEIDKYADASYRAIHAPGKEEVYYPDARTIDPKELPDFDLLWRLPPARRFLQLAGEKGFEDARGTLFFELARVVKEKRPLYLFLENVPGLLSHDRGRTFGVILSALYDLGYHVEWTVLNSKHFGVPQSRRRLFLIGYLDSRCAGKILPVFGTDAKVLYRSSMDGWENESMILPGSPAHRTPADNPDSTL